MAGRSRIMFGAFLLFLMMAATQAQGASFVVKTEPGQGCGQAYDEAGGVVHGLDGFGASVAYVETDKGFTSAVVTSGGKRVKGQVYFHDGNLISITYQTENGACLLSLYIPDTQCFITIHERGITGRGHAITAPCTTSNWKP